MPPPAVTIVAAWISADTGVGPAIASGSHTYSGICALFPHAPMNSKSAIPVATPTGSDGAADITDAKSSVPTAANSQAIPSMNPMSPTRFTRNAFFPAPAALSLG